MSPFVAAAEHATTVQRRLDQTALAVSEILRFARNYKLTWGVAPHGPPASGKSQPHLNWRAVSADAGKHTGRIQCSGGRVPRRGRVCSGPV